MSIFEIGLIGIGLAMDAFAVSVCKGLSMKKINLKNAIIIATYFGVFQLIMPVIGFFIGKACSEFVNNIDHWIAFFLLSVTGINMIKSSFNDEAEKKNDNIDVKTMVVLSIATSIDALAIGITFAFFKINLLLSVLIIGIITFVLSLIGIKIGNTFGDKFQNKAELTGGIILVLIGLKILLEHLGILNT